MTGHTAPPGDEAAAAQRDRPGPVAWVLTGLVRGYQLIVSPWFAPTCRYYPSCSAYAITALARHGALRGTALAAWRLARCHPWSAGGIDHVPPRGHWRDPARDSLPQPVVAGAPAHGHRGAGRTLGDRTPRAAEPSRAHRTRRPE